MKKLLVPAAMALALSPAIARAQSLGTVTIGQVAGANTPAAVSGLINNALTPKVDVNGGTLNSPSISNPVITGGSWSGVTISLGAVTGALTVPTQPNGDNSTKVASDQFVQNAIQGLASGSGGSSPGVTSFNARIGAVTLSLGDITGVLGFTPVSPTTLATYALLASPAFTGTPTVPTAAAGTDSNVAASTAYADRAATAVLNANTSRTISNPLLLTSAGTTLATATVLTSNENLAGTCASGAFALPTGVSPGQEIYLDNVSGATCSIYPASNTQNLINLVSGAPVTLAAGALVTLPNGLSDRFVEVSATEWIAVQS